MGEYARHTYSYTDRDNTPCACPRVDIPLFGISRIMEEVEGGPIKNVV